MADDDNIRVLVLGAGRMGFGAAYDLVRSPEVEAVTLADIDTTRSGSAARLLATRGATLQERCIPPDPFIRALAGRGINIRGRVVEG